MGAEGGEGFDRLHAGQVARLAAERDAAQAQAASLAHVLHTVDDWLGEDAEPTGVMYRLDLARVVAAARETRQLTDPSEVAVMGEENARLRELAASAREQVAAALAELDDGAGGLGWPGPLLATTLAQIDNALAELDPLAPDPDGERPVTDLAPPPHPEDPR